MEKQAGNSSDPQPSRKTDKPSSAAADYGKYIGAGFQLAAPILLGVFAGRWLDGHFGFKTPVFTLVLAMLMLGIGMYLFIKRFLKP